ncbi:PaaX family transcriptional regulator C-terminal domain-containing protein [Sinomonas flava]|uniref:PaaX family transcriptional regulator n=1 Tax=Sinomonas flava TaxID=496857 RepID=UPI0039A6F6C2
MTATDTAGSLEAIRRQTAEGPRARQMLVTLMADYWLGEGALAPSGALVELMQAFGVAEPGTRTLLSRLSKAGRLVVVREGRRTFYRLSRQARARLSSGLEQIAGFDRLPAHPSDHWTCVAFSLPEERRKDRQKLRQGLVWMGFAPLYDGLWVSPRAAVDDVCALVESLCVEAASVFEGDIRGVGSVRGNPADAWDIPKLQGLYWQFLTASEPALARLEADGFDPASALDVRTQLINVWRAYPLLDPGLPQAFLPADWPRRQAQARFLALYDGLAPLALARVRDAVAAHWPDYLGFVGAHRLGPADADRVVHLQ